MSILNESPSAVKSERDEAFYLDLLKVSKVPSHLHEGLALYLAHGVPPGSFLRFVLENDCEAAIRRADLDCRASLGDILVFLVNAAPIPSWGSEGRVASWIDDHQRARKAKAS